MTLSADQLTIASASVAAALPTLPNGSRRALRVWIGATSFAACDFVLALKLPPRAIINQMDERDLTDCLDALAAAGLIGDWQWDLEVEPGEPQAFDTGSRESATPTTVRSSW